MTTIPEASADYGTGRPTELRTADAIERAAAAIERMAEAVIGSIETADAEAAKRPEHDYAREERARQAREARVRAHWDAVIIGGLQSGATFLVWEATDDELTEAEYKALHLDRGAGWNDANLAEQMAWVREHYPHPYGV
jgi:hypothetical protein